MRIFVFSFIWFSIILNAQIERPSYCDCKVKGTPILNKNNNDVELTSKYQSKRLYLKIQNNTSDSIFLFSSYFNLVSESKFLYRYNKIKDELKVSFLPLIPYLYTEYSDRIILDKDNIMKENQNVYDFYVIPPSHEYYFSVATLNIFNNKEYIKDFDVLSLKNFSRKHSKKINVKSNVDKFSLEIAYYTNIDVLCNSNFYYYKEKEFKTAAKDFKILKNIVSK